jgi:ribose-phosphate pyrophosphokinase
MVGRLAIFSGNANQQLAEKVASYLNIGLGQAVVKKFPDGEIDIRIIDDVRETDVFIIQPTCPPVNENLMELLLLIDCFKRASAQRITAVLPYYGYARQDRKAVGRVPISAKLVANLLTASGADRILTMDLHATQIQGFFDIPVDHLFASAVIVDYIQKLNIPDLVVVSPDIGGLKMVNAYAKRLRCEIAVVYKSRIEPGAVTTTDELNIIGNVKGRACLLLDDMISTGGSIELAARLCREHGAKDIYICAVHPVLTPGAERRLKNIDAKLTIITDSIPLYNKDIGRHVVLSVANLLGEAIKRIHLGESVSKLFD